MYYLLCVLLRELPLQSFGIRTGIHGGMTFSVNRSNVLWSIPIAVAFVAISSGLSTTFACRAVDKAAVPLGRAASSVVVASVSTLCCSPCVGSFPNKEFAEKPTCGKYCLTQSGAPLNTSENQENRPPILSLRDRVVSSASENP